jgi:hypothetical protein
VQDTDAETRRLLTEHLGIKEKKVNRAMRDAEGTRWIAINKEKLLSSGHKWLWSIERSLS